MRMSISPMPTQTIMFKSDDFRLGPSERLPWSSLMGRHFDECSFAVFIMKTGRGNDTSTLTWR